MLDLQVNGLTILERGLHCDFWQTPNDEAIDKLCEYLGSEGVTEFYATLITDDASVVEKNIARIAEYLAAKVKPEIMHSRLAAQKPDASQLSAIHIEGGYISKLGIHPSEHQQALGLEFAQRVLNKYPGLIKLWTICPRVDNDGNMAKLLQEHSVRVAYGHSTTTAIEAEQAFDSYGVDLVTHWPNALVVVRDPSEPARFDHRNPSDEYLEFLTMSRPQAEAWASKQGLELGLGFIAYHRDDISITAICGSLEDGDLHMSAEIFKLLASKKAEKLILISDVVAYNSAELKAGHLLGLRGGRVSLAKHLQNRNKIC